MLKNLVSSLKGLLPALFLNVMRRLCTLVGLALGFVDRQSHKAVTFVPVTCLSLWE